MPFEDDFARVLQETADVTPPAGAAALAAGAAQRGRRRRRRNVLAGAAAFALVLGGGATVAARWGPQHVSDRVAANDSTPALPTPSPAASSPGAAASPSATPDAAPSSAPPVSGDSLLALLTGHLAGWQTSNPMSRGTETATGYGGGPYAQFTVTDGEGEGSVAVDIGRQPLPLAVDADWMNCPDPTYQPYTKCSRRQQPDGSYLLVRQGFLNPDNAHGYQQWSAELFRPDGLTVTVVEYNMPGPTTYTLSRSEPPLSPEQMTAIATDPAWLAAARAVPAPPALPAGGNPMGLGFRQASIQSLLATAAPLLPNGLTEADQGGTDGTAHFTVDDGHGKSLFEVTVQDWSIFKEGTSSGADITDSFKDATVLPDGSRVMTYSESDWANHPGIVRNGVDLLRPDHLRVLVHSFNGPSPMLTKTRTKPVLTLEQLQAIADSPTWEGIAK
ncbi:hypothetical protein GCM10009665_23980 [Kitasatospora nipponensis]|uniref:Uncharacterized protein n=1 Tax=Kitasatospora nipponensis TaxID=258049 RepID=A0ABN1W2V3_9ACTN